MRQTMHSLLTTEATLTAIVPSDRWYQAGNVIDVPLTPFVVERWIAPVPVSGRFARQLRLDIHDQRGSYSRIDAFLAAVEPILKAVQQFEGPDGRIAECTFLGNGGDQEHEDYGTNYSWSSWQVIGVRNG